MCIYFGFFFVVRVFGSEIEVFREGGEFGFLEVFKVVFLLV